MLVLFFAFCKLLDTLFFRKFAYQQLIIFLSHDIAIQALYYDFMLIQRMHYAIMRVIKQHIVTNDTIPILVLFGMHQK